MSPTIWRHSTRIKAFSGNGLSTRHSPFAAKHIGRARGLTLQCARTPIKHSKFWNSKFFSAELDDTQVTNINLKHINRTFCDLSTRKNKFSFLNIFFWKWSCVGMILAQVVLSPQTNIDVIDSPQTLGKMETAKNFFLPQWKVRPKHKNVTILLTRFFWPN